MKNLFRVGAALLLTLSLAGVSHAMRYTCTTAGGCSARIVAGGQQWEFTMQAGDVVDTVAGWIVNENDGWSQD